MKKKTTRQLDAEIADILAGPTTGPGSFKPGQRVRCSYRGDHIGKVLAVDDPRAWANTAAFPQDKPSRRAVKEHVARHPTVATRSIPVLYKFGVMWDRRDSLSPVNGTAALSHLGRPGRRKVHQEPTGREVFAAHQRHGHITTSGRRALRPRQFALPPGPEEKRRGIKGRLPIDTIGRAHDALARASLMHHRGHITARQLAQARTAVHKAWPSIELSR